jgi:hypothetical protein
MSEYEIWKYLHILMFVFWVGTDMAVFLSCRKSTDASLPIDARFLLLHMALRIELLPRTMWKAALPLGVMLSRQLDLIDISDTEVALVWLFSLVWWAISVTGAWHYDKPVGHKLARITNWITGAVGVFLIVICIASYMGNGPFAADATWLQLKVAIYGLINILIVVMIKVFDPMGASYGRLAVEGSKPEIESDIMAAWARSAAVIWSVYTLICVVAFIATTKIF